jgi:hypothetical protein
MRGTCSSARAPRASTRRSAKRGSASAVRFAARSLGGLVDYSSNGISMVTLGNERVSVVMAK